MSRCPRRSCCRSAGRPGMTPPVSAAACAAVRRSDRLQRPVPRHEQLLGLRADLRRRDHQRPADRLLRTQRGSMPAPCHSTAPAQAASPPPAPTRPSTVPERQSNTDNFWVDVQVSDYSGAPSGTSLRLWPEFPGPGSTPTTRQHPAAVRHRVHSVAVLHAGQDLDVQPAWRHRPGIPGRDLEHHHPDRSLRHRQQLPVVEVRRRGGSAVPGGFTSITPAPG